MDAAQELVKLQKLTSSAKGKSPSIQATLDSLLQSLYEERERVQAGAATPASIQNLNRKVETSKKDLDDRQKEIYNSISRVGKALDKKFTSPLPTFNPLFTSPKSAAALDRTVALHLLRTGQFATPETFIEEANVDISLELRSQFVDLDRITTALKDGDVGPALRWATENRPFLQARQSPLEFHLHKFQYLKLLSQLHPTAIATALSYAKANFPSFFDSPHMPEVRRLMGCLVYFPVPGLLASPYADFASPSVQWDLDPMFAREYCASLGMSRQIPLKVVADIGGGGALARIEKGRKLMRDRKSEWTQADELPIEIPLPPENRYHSIFACPVSKEQSTDQNPPMMMSCGHVITKDSLQKLAKPGGRVKCPYCPTESQVSNAMRVRF